MRSWGKFSVPEPIFEDQTKRKKLFRWNYGKYGENLRVLSLPLPINHP